MQKEPHMTDFYTTLLTLLKQDPRFTAQDGTFLRNAVYEAAMRLDADLLRLLLKNPETKARFFQEADGLLVFDKSGFAWAINNRQFLPDSYTRFKNKIGLAKEDDSLLSSSNRVCLVFPYKDCVLEGGQTKEDQKRSEIFYNELLAPDEIDRLLDPKAFTGARKYTADGETPVAGLSEDDNLIIKGNNLLGLYSILPRFEGRIRCIFIDPPYFFLATKPSDTFSYNSNFKLSTWLVFLRNRLQAAHRLLAPDGILYMSISDEGAHYLKVMTDEIFSMENFIADVTWESRKSVSSDGLFSQNSNHILVYAKDVNRIDKSRFRLALDPESFRYDDGDGKGRYRLEPFDAPNVRPNLTYPIVNPNTGVEYLPPAGRCWRTERQTYERLLAEGRIRFGADGTSRPQLKTWYSEAKSQGKGKAGSTIWHDVQQSILWQELDANTNATKDQMELFGSSVFTNPKPEDLIRRALELSTQEGDWVLDFFMGSATTQAAALKMNRHFIGFEQMDYIHTVSIPRLVKAMRGEQTGISKDVQWKGGGSFVYCELARLNQRFADAIQAAKSNDALAALYGEMRKSGFISCRIDPSALKVAADDFAALSLKDQKRFLMEILDKNLLYVNLCDLDDAEFGLSEADKAFTRSFYRMNS